MTEESENKNTFFFKYSLLVDSIIRESKNNMYSKVKDLNIIIIAIIPILFAVLSFCYNNTYFTSLLIPTALIITCLGATVIQGFYILLHDESEFNDPTLLIEKYYEQDVDFITLKTASSIAATSMENLRVANIRALQYRNMLIVAGFAIIILVITFWYAVMVYPQFISNIKIE